MSDEWVTTWDAVTDWLANFSNFESEEWSPDFQIRLEGASEGATVCEEELLAVLREFADVPFIVTAFDQP